MISHNHFRIILDLEAFYAILLNQNFGLITLGSGVNKSLSLDSGISWKSLPHDLGVEEVSST